jgi:NAD(P)-dependent dehydrogenase (short-subunit alcohol dehydrogenase family)
MEEAMRLTGKTALITGGAHGMGESIARVFAREGAQVAIADILEREGAQVAAALGPGAMFLRLDVSDEAQWRQAMDAVIARFGRLDILVNNAGISGAVPDRMSVEYFDRLMAVNARGTFLGMKHAIPEMQKRGGGAIVNLSSISGMIGQPFVHMGYNGAKAAIHVMTKSAAVQFGQDRIRVNSVHPGLMPPMRTSVTAADPAVRQKVLASLPLGRAGEPDEVAYAVLFLASDEASYITGAELAVDGGFLAQ